MKNKCDLPASRIPLILIAGTLIGSFPTFAYSQTVKKLPEGLSGSVSVAQKYDDNIFSTRNNKVSDAISLFAARLEYGFVVVMRKAELCRL